MHGERTKAGPLKEAGSHKKFASEQSGRLRVRSGATIQFWDTTSPEVLAERLPEHLRKTARRLHAELGEKSDGEHVRSIGGR